MSRARERHGARMRLALIRAGTARGAALTNRPSGPTAEHPRGLWFDGKLFAEGDGLRLYFRRVQA